MVLKKQSRKIDQAHASRHKPKNAPDARTQDKDTYIEENPNMAGYLYLILFVGLLLLDRLTKMWSTSLKEPIDYGILSFTHVINTGAGFSILSGQNSLLIFISLMILGIIIYFYDKIPRFALMFILAGLIGNLIDRVFVKGVIDFIDFKFWPVFNLADTFIFIGTLIFAIYLIRPEKHTKSLKQPAKKKHSR